jgi:hypothetical protein
VSASVFDRCSADGVDQIVETVAPDAMIRLTLSAAKNAAGETV